MDNNEKRKPQNRSISWGKHIGKKFGEVPNNYLKWFVGNAYHQMTNRKRWAQEELDRRKKEGIII